jgi:pimeloyl-ACP methyl ester carboxylesterase
LSVILWAAAWPSASRWTIPIASWGWCCWTRSPICEPIPARVWQATFATFLREGWFGELGQISVPTLIVWGDQDRFCPRGDQDALVAATPDSQLLVYPGAGHALHWEEPDRFAADLVMFTEQRVHDRRNLDPHG